MARLAAMLLLATALPAAADVMVTGPKACALLAEAEPGNPFSAIDDEHMVFDLEVIETIEYHCAFTPAFAPPGDLTELQTRVGYCMEPGPLVMPGVFTLFDRGDGTAQLDGSDWDEPLILSICPGW